jgi:hypothetical protein
VQQLVKDHAQRVNVGARVDGLALHLLRRHVCGRSNHAAGRGQSLLVVDELRDAEVEDLRLAAIRDEDVVRLDVAMYDAEVMGDADRRKQLLQQVHRHVHAETPVLVEPRAHRAAFDPLHDDEQHRAVLVEVVDADDARVVQRRYGRGLAVEALAEVRVARVLLGQDLDGDRYLQARMRGAINDSHRSPPELRLDRVFAELS